MSLLCRLGRHRPRGIPRWNDGLYFATCERCGRDLVRTAFEGWRVPAGYRVVWSDRPPESRPEVALVPTKTGIDAPSAIPAGAVPLPSASEAGAGAAFPASEAARDLVGAPAPPPATESHQPAPEPSVEPAALDDDASTPAAPPAGRSENVRLPIQDVLAHLAAEESANRAGEAPPAEAQAVVPQPAPPPLPPLPVEPPARPRRSTWDFDDDDFFEEEKARFAQRPGSLAGAPAAAGAPSVDQGAEPVSRKAGGLPEQWRRARSAARNFWSGPAEPRPLLVTGLALAVAVAVALALYSAGYPAPGSLPDSPGTAPVASAGSESPGPSGRPDPFAASAPHVPAGRPEATEAQPAAAGSASDEVAYVAASLLICRSAPIPQAPRVRNLVRGKEVRVLGYDGAWASLAYRGAQCWAQAQYLSPVPTL